MSNAFRGVDTVEAHLLQYRAGCRPLERQGSDLVRHVADRDVGISESCHLQPRDACAAAGEHEAVACEFEDRAVVDDPAIVVTPHAVSDAIETDLFDIARDHAIQHRFGIGSADLVLLHWTDVVGAAGIAYAEILVLGVVVKVGELVAVPRRPGLANVQSFLSLVKGR